MKKIITMLGTLLLVIILVVAFAPKRYLYNLAQIEGAKEGIIVSHEITKEGLFALDILNAHIYIKDILVGETEKIAIYPFILYNHVKGESFVSSKDFSTLFAMTIDKVSLTHWLFNPYKITLKTEGSFGMAEGFIHLKERKIYLKIFPVQSFVSQLNTIAKKSEEGFYTYEYSY